MNDSDPATTRAWLIKAKRDLDSAARLVDDADPYLDTAIYHCQQAGEKALKAFLVFHELPFAKTHDLRLLAMQAAGIEPRFAAWREVVALLTPYATEFRYADEPLEPDEATFDEAFNAATALYRFVLSLLPQEVQP